MGKCQICSKGSRTIASVLSLCYGCLKSRFEETEQFVREIHARSRRPFRLPERPPADRDGFICAICSQGCRIPKGGIGYCGLPHGDRKKSAVVSWYYDPLPTNCVADFVCPAGTGCGYPRYAYRPGPEFGYKNLAVFYEACSFNCLFCQNWHYRYGLQRKRSVTPEQLVHAVDDRTACICYFGGDPTPINERPEVPLLVASTLLVLGYVDFDEVRHIAHFIARLSPNIPYSLLAFHPDFLMDDLPTTSWEHMRRCYEAAKEAGLTTVHIGNRHLLWSGDYEQLPP